MKINKEIEDCLNEQFPKGKCKERGNALILNAIANIELENQENSFKEFIKKLKEHNKFTIDKGKSNGKFIIISIKELDKLAEDKINKEIKK